MHNNLTPVKIAGGGIAGLAAAMYLRKKNFKVVVYEKESKIVIKTIKKAVTKPFFKTVIFLEA